MEDINPKIENGGATANGRLSAAEFNDRNEEAENAVTRSGQALAIGNTTQLAESLFLNGTKASSFQDTGVVNVVDLRPLSGASGVKVPADYTSMDGATVSFKPAVNNTGAVTVNIGQTAGIGAKPLVLSTDFSALTGSELDTTQYAEIQYDLAGDRWLLLPWSLPAAVVSFPILVSQGGTGATTQGGAQTNLNVPPKTLDLTTTGLVSGGGNLSSNRNFDVQASSQVQAEAGTDNTTSMTPLRVAQAIAALGGTGGLVGVTEITATGLTVYDPSVNGAIKVVIIATAGGGGSGSPNVTTLANERGVSSGGGAGSTAIKFYTFDTGATTLNVTVGVGGAAGTGGGNGSTGGTTTVTESDGPASNVTTSLGGLGSSGTVSGFGVTTQPGIRSGIDGGAATVGDLLIAGGSSDYAILLADSLAPASGSSGGASFWGGGARGISMSGVTTSQTLPKNGLAFGSGAGGAASRNGLIGQNTTGATGAPGVVQIYEFA